MRRRVALSALRTILRCLRIRNKLVAVERRRSTAGGRLEGARKRALQLHLKEAKRDDFLEHRARQLQRLVIQPYSDALAQRVRNPDSTMRGRAVFFKGAHYEFSHPGAWSPNG
jgi:hypothetical protein